jgi:sarcosine oxidase/L-pipecolate oxidase
MDPEPQPSVLIVGAGVFGTSTAYHLSLTHPDPSLITLIDRTPYPPSHAASTDINKIVRTDYTSLFYMELAYEAMAAWNTWPDLRDEQGPFFHRTGWIALEGEGNDIAQRIRQNFASRNSIDPTSDLSLDDSMRERWNGLLKDATFDGLQSAYWNGETGWVDAAAAVEKMTVEAVQRGVRYVCGDVDKLIIGEAGVSGVQTTDGKGYEADKVLLCTGAWSSKLLTTAEDTLSIEEENRIEYQVTAAGVCVAHFKLTDAEMQELEGMPIVIYSEEGDVQPPPRRSRPAPPGDHMLKYTRSYSFTNTVQTPSGHLISVPPDRDQSIVPEKLKQELMECIASKSVPRYANRPVAYWRMCWDSITPTQDQLITKHPDPRLDGLYLAIGGSFHSWKFLPIIGKYAVNVLNDKSNGAEKDSH